ncbi:MAG TPA: DUF6531 domain-containing protein [Microthrixaceae bacterium]|nr:DUF6531 domain-containing protein [Microthrixaceae bacterium]
MSAVSGLVAGGGTPTSQALAQGIAELDAYATSGEKRIVLLTDGDNQCAPTICQAVQSSLAADIEFSLYTVGLGSAINVADLTCAAQAAGGEYLPSPTPEDLAETIAEAVTAGSYVWAQWRFFGDVLSGGWAGDPVGTAYGNFYDSFVDIPAQAGVFGLDVGRSYNSQDDVAGVLGRGWRAPFSQSAVVETGGVRVTLADGRQVLFEDDGAGGWEQPLEFAGRLSEVSPSVFRVTFADGGYWDFDSSGRLGLLSSWDGQSVVVNRNSGGDVTSVVSSLGPSVTFSYTSGSLVGAATSDGRSVSYAYNLAGDLVGVTDVSGGSTVYLVDASGRIEKITNPEGLVLVDNTYNTLGRVVSQTTPDSTSTFVYNYLARTTTVTLSGVSEVLTYHHDEFGRLVKITDPDGKSMEQGYGLGGWMTSGVSRLGGETVTSFDATGNPLTVLEPSGALTEYTYDSANRVKTVTSSTAGLTTFTYTGASRVPSSITDDNSGVSSQSVVDGLVTSSTDADGVVTEFRYNSLRQMVESEDAYGSITEYEYDAAGRRDAVVSPLGARTETLFDAAGRVIKTIAADGGVTLTSYDTSGRILTATDEIGAVESYTYDPVSGQVATSTDRMGRVTTFIYDGLGQLAKSVYNDLSFTETEYGILGRVAVERDELGRETSYTYDDDGNLSTATDPAGGVNETLYDTAGRVAKQTDPVGAETTYNYNPTSGQLSSEVTPAGTTSYTYDNLGRVETTTDYRGGVSTTTYTPGGRVASETDPTGLVTAYTYDNAGRRSKVTAPGGLETTTVYDGDGRVVSVTSPGGLVSSSTYDQVGRVLTSTDLTGILDTNTWTLRSELATSTRSGEGTVQYKYLADGQLDWVKDALGNQTTFGYDARGRQVTRTDANNKVWATGLNNAGEVVSETDPLARVTTYGYDPAGRVATVADPSGRGTVNTWRPDGSLAGWTATDGTEVQANTYTYDTAGRRVGASVNGAAFAYSYTSGGDLASVTDDIGRTLSYSYDVAGRRTGMRRVDGTGVAYSYDAAGRVDKITPTETLADSFTAVGGQPDANKWTTFAAVGGSVGVVDNQARLEVPAGHGLKSWIESKAPKAANGDSTFTYKFDSSATQVKLRAIQRRLAETDNYRLEILSNDSTARIYGTVWGVESLLGSFTVPVDTDTHHARLSVTGTSVCAKVWDAGVSEPTGWSKCASDGWLIGLGAARIELTGATGAGNAVTIDDFSHTTPGVTVTPYVDYSWDNDGHLNGEALASGGSRTWTWTNGRVTKLQQAGISGANATTNLTYDTTGRIKTETTGSKAVTYGYDAGSQLTSATPNTGPTSTWAYDTLGRRASQTVGTTTTAYTYDDASQLTAATPTTGQASAYTYDQAGRRSSETVGTDTTSYTYNPAGQLAQTELPDGDTQNRVYTPDGSPRALINLVDSTDMTFWFLDWDPTTSPTELVSITTQPAGGTSTATNLTRVPGTPWAASDSGRQRHDLPTDVHGSTKPTPVSTLGQAASYTAWGQPETTPADPLTPQLGYRGELTTTGLIHLRARQYNPTTGQFTTTDPLPGVNGTTTLNNPYHYTNNNPLNHTDPTGLRTDDTGLRKSCRTGSSLGSTPPSTHDAMGGNSSGSIACISNPKSLWQYKLDFDELVLQFLEGPGGTAISLSHPMGDMARQTALSGYNCELAAFERTNEKVWGIDGHCTATTIDLVGALLALKLPIRIPKTPSRPGSYANWGDEISDGARMVDQPFNALSTSQLRAVNSLQRQADIHRQKLADYVANPDAYDNLGHLANAPNAAVRRRIIDGRVRHLNQEINSFEDQIRKILGGG